MTDPQDDIQYRHWQAQYGTHAANKMWEIVQMRDAKIERLKAQAKRDQSAIEATYIVQRDMKAEIERLKAELAAFKDAYTGGK